MGTAMQKWDKLAHNYDDSTVLLHILPGKVEPSG
jgi:hypothetical protein